MTTDMKKVLAILSAGVLALLAVSCLKEEEKVIFDPTQVTAPLLGTYTQDDDAFYINYIPAKIQMGFNEKMAPRHTVAIVALDGSEVSKSLTTSDDGSTLTLKKVNLSKALVSLGKKEGETARIELAIRASLQEASKDNGVNGYVDSNKHMGIASFLVEIPEVQGNPWEAFTKSSPWGLIGSIESTGNSWNADGPMFMTEDGKKHVARAVKFTTSDQFKVRKDGGWDTNFGAPGETEPYVMAVGEAIEATSSGKNLAVPSDGIYDLLLDEEAGTLTLTEAFLTYPGFDEVSTWSVIGAIPSVEMSWDKDIQMTTDGTWHVAEGVVLTKSDQFKFRKDCKWDTNIGAPGDTEPFVVTLDEEMSGTANGKNLAVPEDGTYDLLVNPDANLFKVVVSLGGKSPLVGGTDTPEPPAVTGWNIIGLNGDWENDVLATNDGDLWTAYITAEGDTEFKWRKDGLWDENYGGTFVALGEPFDAVAGGDNIKIGAGFYKAVFDAANLKITISNGEVWSLIGDFNEWSGDVDMTLTDGLWVSPATKIEGGFKIRKNHDWTDNVGGTFAAVGTAFAAVPGGDNITVPAGNYVVTYDPEAATIVVDEVGWGLVGTINGWGNTPDIVLKEEGNFLVAKNVTLSADDEIKLRYNQDWADNRGGNSLVGIPVKAVPGGDNIKPGAGTYDVYYRPESEVIIVAEAGASLTYWGVVGTINGWGAPDILLYQNDEGKLESKEIEISSTDEIKIRVNEDWAENRGGTFANLGEAFAVENNGANIKVGRDAKITVVYDAASETITINGEYIGDAPSLPTTMYMIGDQFGSWNWEDAGIAELVPVWGTQGVFWCTRWFDHTKGFKFCAQKAWNGDFTGAGTVGYTVSDGNCWVAEDGFYTVLVDASDNSVEIAPAEVYGIGDAWGSDAWDFNAADPVKFTAEGQTLVATVTNNSTAVRLASKVKPSTEKAGITPNGWYDWWKTEFVYFDGKIAYRGLGGDQERVAVTAGDKITLDFNAGTVTVGSGAAAAGITIDGSFDDWADIEEFASEQTSRIRLWKFSSDAENVYFYFKLRGDRLGKVMHISFDTDNDASTGGDYGNTAGTDVGVTTYPVTEGTTTFVSGYDPVSKLGSEETANLVYCAGAMGTDSEGYVELSISRATLGLTTSGATIAVGCAYDWYVTGKQTVTLK